MIKHSAECRVIYGDTDGFGIVYHANYFRWFEIGRAELFRALGTSYKEITEKGVHLPVSEAYCKFIKALKYDDILLVETKIDERVKGGMKFDFRIFVKGDKTPSATGFTRHACVDDDKKIIRPPKFLLDLVKNSLLSDK